MKNQKIVIGFDSLKDMTIGEIVKLEEKVIKFNTHEIEKRK